MSSKQCFYLKYQNQRNVLDSLFPTIVIYLFYRDNEHKLQCDDRVSDNMHKQAVSKRDFPQRY